MLCGIYAGRCYVAVKISDIWDNKLLNAAHVSKLVLFDSEIRGVPGYPANS